MSELVKRPATWMARAVRDGDVGAVELLEAHAARIEERNGAINAIVLERLEAARAEAGAADAARARGEPLPRPADLRAAFDVILAHQLVPELARIPPGQEAELTPYVAEMVAAGRRFSPSFAAYTGAFTRIAEIEAEAARCVRARVPSCCARWRPT